jgi:hypothetical protein
LSVFGPQHEEIDRVLFEQHGQILSRAALGSLIQPYVGSYHDGNRWERNSVWVFIDGFVKRGRILVVDDGYLIGEPLQLVPSGARQRLSPLAAD